MKIAKKRDEEIRKLRESTDRRLLEKDEEIKQLREDTHRQFLEKDHEIRLLKKMLESMKVKQNIQNEKVQGMCCFGNYEISDYCCSIWIFRLTCFAWFLIWFVMYRTCVYLYMISYTYMYMLYYVVYTTYTHTHTLLLQLLLSDCIFYSVLCYLCPTIDLLQACMKI